ncbi:MAG TPA: iron-containing alcohol dehydrogenase [Bacillota bacterium]|nr:iron-containing alcohol dehydrogenase [Bacillota bacterium]
MANSERLKDRARTLLRDFKGASYAFGVDVLSETGKFASELGMTALGIANRNPWIIPVLDKVMDSLRKHGVTVVGEGVVRGSAPNSPREDVYRMAAGILQFEPDCIVAVGGGSTIDAVKAANVLASLGKWDLEIDSFFGTGLVTEAMTKYGAGLIPMVAVETAAGSAAHLTKYSNVTDLVAGQKKLIVDDAIIPDRAVFDYLITKSISVPTTLDGAFDGLGHCLEVFYGIPEDKYDLASEIAEVAIELIVANVEQVAKDPSDEGARIALGLATDLGGYAIMVGGTSGAHLTSFSLVDIASHGRAVTIMNPYYTVFFAPAIQRQLRVIGDIYKRYGFIDGDLSSISGRELGIAVAEGMINLNKKVGYPTTLAELPGFCEEHIERALSAAKNPQLEMKLKNMPVPLDSSTVENYMRPILQSAATGDLDLIVN